MTADHTAAAERHREDANTASNAGAYARAQVAALTAISHSIDALVAELVAEHHPAAELELGQTLHTGDHVTWSPGIVRQTAAGYFEVCPHDETRLNPDGSETCLQCDSWHPDATPAAEQDPLELELDGDDPTVEQHRPNLAAYGRHGYIPSATEA